VVSALLVHPFGVNGLASANSLSSLTEAAILYFVLRSRIGASDDELAGGSMFRIVLASIAMALAGYFINGILWHDAGTIWQHIATLAVDIVTSGAVFLGVGTLLRVKELAQLLAFMADYIGRRAASVAGQ